VESTIFVASVRVKVWTFLHFTKSTMISLLVDGLDVKAKELSTRLEKR